VARTRSLLLAVVLLGVLTGCNAAFGDRTGGPTERTVTPAPVPTDRPRTGTVPLSPGLSTDGVTDPAGLERAHVEALANATFVERGRTTVRFDDGSLAVEETYVGRHGTNASRISLRRSGTAEYGVPDRSLVRAEVWGNASFGARRLVTASGRTELGVFDGPGGFYGRPRGGYGLALREAETDLRVRRTQSGSTEYVVTAEGVDADGPWYLRRTFLRVRGEGRARVQLDPDGTIRRFDVEFPVRTEGRNATLRHTYTVEFGAAAVTRPGWFEAAVASGRPPSLPRAAVPATDSRSRSRPARPHRFAATRSE